MICLQLNRDTEQECGEWSPGAIIYINSSSSGSATRPSSFQISINWTSVSAQSSGKKRHTVAFCASPSSVVSKAVVAKWSRCQETGFSWRFVAVLSPMALFFPITNLLHLLEKKELERDCNRRIRRTPQKPSTNFSNEPSAA